MLDIEYIQYLLCFVAVSWLLQLKCEKKTALQGQPPFLLRVRGQKDMRIRESVSFLAKDPKKFSHSRLFVQKLQICGFQFRLAVQKSSRANRAQHTCAPCRGEQHHAAKAVPHSEHTASMLQLCCSVVSLAASQQGTHECFFRPAQRDHQKSRLLDIAVCETQDHWKLKTLKLTLKPEIGTRKNCSPQHSYKTQFQAFSILWCLSGFQVLPRMLPFTILHAQHPGFLKLRISILKGQAVTIAVSENVLQNLQSILKWQLMWAQSSAN